MNQPGTQKIYSWQKRIKRDIFALEVRKNVFDTPSETYQQGQHISRRRRGSSPRPRRTLRMPPWKSELRTRRTRTSHIGACSRSRRQPVQRQQASRWHPKRGQDMMLDGHLMTLTLSSLVNACHTFMFSELKQLFNTE